jgi:membrane fusion protein, multidrug efflux system
MSIRTIRPTWRLGAIAVAVAVVVATAACGRANGTQGPPGGGGGGGGGGAAAGGGGGGGPPAMPAKVLTLAPTEIQDATEYLGRLKSRRSILVQPQVDGQITKIFVKSGDVVDVGAPLLQIDPARQQAAVSSAQANRAAQLARLELAKQDLARVERLYAEDAVPKAQLDQAKANLAAAQAQVEALGAATRENEVQLDYYRITAPTHGVVGDIPVRVGDRVTPATRLTTLDDNSALEANISIPIERASLVKVGTEIQVVDDSHKTVAAGHVYFISAQVSPETQSVLIKSDLGTEGTPLRPEQIVRARVVFGTHPGLTVPALAVVRMNGQPFVFVAQKTDKGTMAKQKPVTLGELVDGNYPVTSGLAAGEQVVVGGVQKLRDGAPIAPQT